MKLIELEKNIEKAEIAMRKELEKRWPVDSQIEVYLRASQTCPSIMTVQAHRGNGYINAFMLTRRGRFVREVYFKNIVGGK